MTATDQPSSTQCNSDQFQSNQAKTLQTDSYQFKFAQNLKPSVTAVTAISKLQLDNSFKNPPKNEVG